MSTSFNAWNSQVPYPLRAGYSGDVPNAILADLRIGLDTGLASPEVYVAALTRRGGTVFLSIESVDGTPLATCLAESPVPGALYPLAADQAFVFGWVSFGPEAASQDLYILPAPVELSPEVVTPWIDGVPIFRLSIEGRNITTSLTGFVAGSGFSAAVGTGPLMRLKVDRSVVSGGNDDLRLKQADPGYVYELGPATPDAAGNIDISFSQADVVPSCGRRDILSLDGPVASTSLASWHNKRDPSETSGCGTFSDGSTVVDTLVDSQTILLEPAVGTGLIFTYTDEA